MTPLHMSKEELQIKSTQAHIEEMRDPEFVKAHQLGFARVSIFNPRTIKDSIRVIFNITKGIMPRTEDYWSMERFNPSHPMTVKRFIRTIPEKTGHNRSNSYYYKSATIKETCAPLMLTAHAVSRFRERGGYFMPEKDVWNRLPELVSCIVKKDDKVYQRRDILLPYGDGAFIGYTTDQLLGFTEIIKWKRKHGIVSTEHTDGGQGFTAFTWIARDDMMRFQRDILDAYQDGDSQAAMKIQEDNINPKQLYETNTIIMTDYDNLENT